MSIRGGAAVNGNVSFWYAEVGLPERRQPLDGDRKADVCIVGAGLTGLWTSYYLSREQPELRIVVVEKEFAGFGASGRNGGWLSAELAVSRERYRAAHGELAVKDMLVAMRECVDEVIAVAGAESIEADIAKNGLLHVARNPAQLHRIHESLATEKAWGAGDEDFVFLDRAELAQRVVVNGALGATFTPHAARVQPAKLVQGLAAAVQRRGVSILEGTTVSSAEKGLVRTDRGNVRAAVVLVCLEGFTTSLQGRRRDWLPMNSSMVVTDPLPESTWAQLRWSGAELLGDAAHGYMYAQRTADNRVALGGRGIPYRYGSRTDDHGHTQRRTIETLTRLLHAMFPPTVEAPIAHAWSGVLGVPRDWNATVSFDRSTGLGTAGGYVGSGLTTTNLAGRTMVDLVLNRTTRLTALPWVNHQVRPWEPEPLRWLGVRSMYHLYRYADHRERVRGTPRSSRIATVANHLTGR